MEKVKNMRRGNINLSGAAATQKIAQIKEDFIRDAKELTYNVRNLEGSDSPNQLKGK